MYKREKMDIYYRLPEDIQRSFFMYFRHPNAENIRRRHSVKLMKELKEYNAFKRDVMERIIAQSNLKHHDFIDMRSVRFSIGWYTRAERRIFKHQNNQLLDFLQGEKNN